MKIGFDLHTISDYKDELELISSKPDVKVRTLFSALVAAGHELLVYSPVNALKNRDDLLRIKKKFIKNWKSASSFRFAFISKENILNSAANDHIDIFISSNQAISQKLSAFTDSLYFSSGSDFNKLRSDIENIVSKNRESVIPADSVPDNLPSEDKLWLKYYRIGDLKWQNTSMSPYERLAVSNRNWLDETAMEFFGKRFTYEEFLQRVDKLCDIMRADGICKGMRVPIIFVNTPESLIILYALYKTKATIAPIFPLSTKEDMQNKLRNISEQNKADGFSVTKMFISDLVCGRFADFIPSDMQPVVLAITDSMPKVLSFAFRHVVMPKMGIKPVQFSDRFISFSKYCERKVKNLPAVDTSFNNNYTAVQLYTGGTIKPKGVMLSEGNIDAASKQFYNDRFAFHRGDKIAAFMPLNHSFGLIIGTHVAATLGVDLDIIMKINFKRLDKLFLKDRINLFGGIPNMFPAIRNNPHFKKADLSHVKYILSGGSSIDETEKNRTTEFFKSHNSQAEVHDGYGLTESAGGIIYDGVPNIGTDVKIVEPGTVNELGYEHLGELCLSGPQIMRGYDDDTLNAAVLRIHSDGKKWLHTGDNAMIHSNGIIEIVGRMDRMIKVNGEQVILDDIEELINTLPFVEKSAVVKKSDSKRGFVPVAYVMLKPDEKWSDEIKMSIEQLYTEKLTAFARPRKTSVIKEFPVTAVGKVDFKALEKLDEE